MPSDDERHKPRRLQSQTERDNDAWRRQQQRKTSPGGVPAIIEDELTPPPIMLDDIAPRDAGEVQSAIREIRAAHNRSAEAIAHEQRARREGKEFGQLEEKVASLAGVAQSVIQVGTVLNETVLPVVRELTRDMQRVLESRAVDIQMREQMAGTTERLQRELGALNGQLAEVVRRVEAATSKTNTDVALLAQRLDSVATSTSDKIRVLDADLRGALARVVTLESDRAVATALTTREKVGLVGGGGSVGAAILWVLQHFFG